MQPSHRWATVAFLVTSDKTAFSAPFNDKKIPQNLFHAESLKLDMPSKCEKQVKRWTNLSHDGWFWVNSSSRWQQSLSLPALIFLLDDPKQLISTRNPAAPLVALMQRPSGNGSAALLEWRNHIKNVGGRSTAVPRGANYGLSPTITLYYPQTVAMRTYKTAICRDGYHFFIEESKFEKKELVHLYVFMYKAK